MKPRIPRPYLPLVEEADATGELESAYEKVRQDSGKVANIVKTMSLRPATLQRVTELYGSIMYGPSELSRVQREVLSIVVSTANACHY